MTMGTDQSPFDRYRVRAASLTIWSKAGWMKSANWISAIGISPLSAAPMATPTMPDSASGVSSTRASPNLAYRPSVAPKTPPLRPTSSPITSTRSSRSISSVMAARTASIILISATWFSREDIVQRPGSFWGGSLPGLADRRLDGARGLALDLVVRGEREHPVRLQAPPHAIDRVLPGLRLQLLGGPHASVRRGGRELDDHHVDQGRAAAEPSPLGRPREGCHRGAEIAAVDGLGGEPIALG